MGNFCMVFFLKLKFGFLLIEILVVIWGLDLDGEVWVKFRLIFIEFWVGIVIWVFVVLFKVILVLVLFWFFNFMGM